MSSQRRAADDPSSGTRLKLLEATARLVETVGVDAVTSRKIADEAGENLGSITYYFGSKDELVAEALLATARKLISPVADVLCSSEIDAFQKLTAATQLMYQLLQTDADRLPGYVAGLGAAATNDALREQFASLHQECAAAISAEVRVQVEAGTVEPWVQADAIGQLVIALVNGIAIGTVIDPDHTDVAAIGAQMAQLLMQARTQ